MIPLFFLCRCNRFFTTLTIFFCSFTLFDFFHHYVCNARTFYATLEGFSRGSWHSNNEKNCIFFPSRVRDKSPLAIFLWVSFHRGQLGPGPPAPSFLGYFFCRDCFNWGVNRPSSVCHAISPRFFFFRNLVSLFGCSVVISNPTSFRASPRVMW